MRKVLVILMVIGAVNLLGAKGFYDQLTPPQRKAFSEDWLMTGKAYLEADNKKDARASFTYSHNLYPMGEAASEARELLSKHFKVGLSYNPDTQFSAYVKRAEKLSGSRRLNNYLMALVIKPENADTLYKVALTYKSLDNIEKAKEYARLAIEAGYDKEKVDESLK
jgi:TolA-binding protein